MMYIVFIINHIHHLIDEFKMLIFTYNNDRKMYILIDLKKKIYKLMEYNSILAFVRKKYTINLLFQKQKNQKKH